ncbi:MAG: MATE family efflux transporter [Christensenellales bacterium]|mgnify:CR=1 FL=1|jgi:putative MATE family efflux protein
MSKESFQTTQKRQNKRVWSLLVPMIVEQIANVVVAFINAIMVSGVGETALSAISLVDTITLVLVQLFTAIGAGGGILAAQYLGSKDKIGARRTANLTAIMVLGASVVIAAVTCLFHMPLLHTIYPSVTGITMTYCAQYLLWTAASFPLMALHSAGVGLLYAEGSSRASMYVTLAVNAVKILGNQVLISNMGLAVVGAGAATLLSRAVGAILVTVLLCDKRRPLHYSWPLIPLDVATGRRILRVAVPSGVENLLFLLAKLVIGTIIATFPGAMIAANAAANTLSGFINIPSSAINLAMMTIVGQAVGAGRTQEARSSTKRLLRLSMLLKFVMCLLMFIGVHPITGLLSLSSQAHMETTRILRLYCLMSVVFEPLSFGLPCALRAAGDTKNTMYISIASVFLVRTVFSFVLVQFGLGVHGIWLAMYMDWITRGALFMLRFRGNKWLEKALV